MIITKETDYALRILRVLLDGEKHSVAEMSETELIPNQFAYQILRKLSAGNLVQVSRGALGLSLIHIWCKIAACLVHGKPLHITGGNYRICGGQEAAHCGRCCRTQRARCV